MKKIIHFLADADPMQLKRRTRATTILMWLGLLGWCLIAHYAEARYGPAPNKPNWPALLPMRRKLLVTGAILDALPRYSWLLLHLNMAFQEARKRVSAPLWKTGLFFLIQAAVPYLIVRINVQIDMDHQGTYYHALIYHLLDLKRPPLSSRSFFMRFYSTLSASLCRCWR